ncbi:hypothetical protein V6N12_051458 [Hibiscus sabdariffa]|uniref:Ubiquitin fusion degradation protein UFD1 N-terminal subdomain 1 domain-containing protein n=1 Tax=Hibiscus sabdariffa TaxID=183260 RepID=A0ABR2GFF6_9ROSI
MPPSALDRLASLQIDYLMLFELRNDAAERASHCGVLEFITEEVVIYMPYWMMENLLLQEGDIVKVKNAKLESFTLEQGATNFGIAIVMSNDVREKVTTMKQEVKPTKAHNLMTKAERAEAPNRASSIVRLRGPCHPTTKQGGKGESSPRRTELAKSQRFTALMVTVMFVGVMVIPKNTVAVVMNHN